MVLEKYVSHQKHFPIPKVRKNVPPNPNRLQKLVKSARRGRSAQNFAQNPTFSTFKKRICCFSAFCVFFLRFTLQFASKSRRKQAKNLRKAGTKQQFFFELVETEEVVLQGERENAPRVLRVWPEAEFGLKNARMRAYAYRVSLAC